MGKLRVESSEWSVVKCYASINVFATPSRSQGNQLWSRPVRLFGETEGTSKREVDVDYVKDRLGQRVVGKKSRGNEQSRQKTCEFQGGGPLKKFSERFGMGNERSASKGSIFNECAGPKSEAKRGIAVRGEEISGGRPGVL